MKFIIGIVSFIISAFSVILIETIFLSGMYISGSSTIQDGTNANDIFGLVNFILIGGLTKVVYNYLLNLYNKKFTFQYKPIDLGDYSSKYDKQEELNGSFNGIDEDKRTNEVIDVINLNTPVTKNNTNTEENNPSILKVILSSIFYTIAILIIVIVIVVIRNS